MKWKSKFSLPMILLFFCAAGIQFGMEKSLNFNGLLFFTVGMQYLRSEAVPAEGSGKEPQSSDSMVLGLSMLLLLLWSAFCFFAGGTERFSALEGLWRLPMVILGGMSFLRAAGWLLYLRNSEKKP